MLSTRDLQSAFARSNREAGDIICDADSIS